MEHVKSVHRIWWQVTIKNLAIIQDANITKKLMRMVNVLQFVNLMKYIQNDFMIQKTILSAVI